MLVLMPCSPLPSTDSKLIQIVDAALAEAARKSGEWLVCRPGCTQCCIGAFPISQLDAVRLQHGILELEARDPERALAIRERARESVARFSSSFPGDPGTGILAEDEESERRFENFANEEPCPALSPETGRCEVYSSRPMTCRVFGPPIRSESEGGLGVCELCYHGATAEEVADCEMVPDPDDLEPALIEEAEQASGRRGRTTVAFALAK